MAIWIELTILLLFTYAIGLGIGWLLWGRNAAAEQASEQPTDI